MTSKVLEYLELKVNITARLDLVKITMTGRGTTWER
jgi:hypothetical protein